MRSIADMPRTTALVGFRAGDLVREPAARSAFFHLVEITALEHAEAFGVR
jgi:hypothetical protein